MKKQFLLLLSFLFVQLTFAQKEANNWLFGDNITFTLSDKTPTLKTGVQGNFGVEGEMASSISDKDGNLLFYLVGTKLYNYNGTVVASDLKSNETSGQGGTIVRKPGTTNRYYIFTSLPYIMQINMQSGYFYTEVEYDFVQKTMTVIQKNIALPIAQHMMEPLMIVPHSNGIDMWLITHTANSNEYYVYAVNNQGISKPIISAIGQTIPVVQNAPITTGALKSNSCYNKLAFASLATNQIDVVDFDNSTGKISTVYNQLNGFSVSQQGNNLYSVEFSPNGQFLYATEYDTKKLYQFDLNTTDVKASKTLLATGTTVRLGQLQLAPNGKIYFTQHSWGGTSYLGVINNPNVQGANSNVVLQYLTADYLKNQTITMGLPNFPKHYVANIPTLLVNDMPYSNQLTVCAGNLVQFDAMIDNQVTQNTSFKIGGIALNGNTYTFEKGGKYIINMNVTTACGFVKVTDFSLTVLDKSSIILAYKNPTGTRCASTPITVKASSTTSNVVDYAWYDSEIMGNKLGQGAEYTYQGKLPATVWATPIGKTQEGIGSKISYFQTNVSANAHTKFVMLKKGILKSVQLSTFDFLGKCDTTKITYEIRKDDPLTGDLILSKTHAIKGCGLHQLPIDQELEQGTYFVVYKSKTGGMSVDGSGTSSYTYTKPYENEVISVQDGGYTKEGLFNNFIVQEIFPCTERTSFTITSNYVATTPKLVMTSSLVCLAQATSFSVEGGSQNATYEWIAPKNTIITGTGASISLSSTNVQGQDTLNVIVNDNQVCGTTHHLKEIIFYVTVPEISNMSIVGNGTVCKGTNDLKYTVNGSSNQPIQGFKWSLIDNKIEEVLQEKGGSTITTNRIGQVQVGDRQALKVVTMNVKPYNMCGTAVNPVAKKIQVDNVAPQAFVLTDTIKVCANEKMQLTANPPLYGQASWTKISKGAGTIVDTLLYDTEVNDLMYGDVFTGKWTIKNGVCPANSVNQTIAVKTEKECTVTNFENQTSNSIVAYPNPFTEGIHLKNIPNSVEKIELVNVLGNVVETQKNNDSIVLGENAPNGTYLIYFYSVDNVEVIKVVKAK